MTPVSSTILQFGDESAPRACSTPGSRRGGHELSAQLQAADSSSPMRRPRQEPSTAINDHVLGHGTGCRS